MDNQGLNPLEMDSLLNQKSGILGITGRYTDRRDVIKNAEKGDYRCQLALDIESYRIKKYIGAYAAALGGLDAIVFTAGVGENAGIIREKALEGLEFLGIELDHEKNLKTFSKDGETEITTPDSTVKVFVIPTNEELVFVEDVVAIMNETYTNHLEFQYSFTDPDYKP